MPTQLSPSALIEKHVFSGIIIAGNRRFDSIADLEEWHEATSCRRPLIFAELEAASVVSEHFGLFR